jgi:type II secretory pathway pseudopilin PulG
VATAKAAPATNRRSLQLAIVVLLIVVLVGFFAVGASKFSDNAQDAAAKRAARRALVAQRSIYSDNGTYGDAAAVSAAEPSLAVSDRPPQVLGQVYVRSDGATTTLASADNDGNCYWIRDNGISTLYAEAKCGQEPAATEFKRSW